MRWRLSPPPVEVIVQVVLARTEGLTIEPAQRVCARAQMHDCATYLDAESGRYADAKSLFQLLLLGVTAGEPLTVRCSGPGAQAACDAIVDALFTT